MSTALALPRGDPCPDGRQRTQALEGDRMVMALLTALLCRVWGPRGGQGSWLPLRSDP